MVAKVDKKLLTQSVQDMLENRQLVGPAVGLLMHFPGLAVQFSPVEAMLALISDGQLSMTQKWAAELGPSTQVSEVEPPLFMSIWAQNAIGNLPTRLDLCLDISSRNQFNASNPALVMHFGDASKPSSNGCIYVIASYGFLL